MSNEDISRHGTYSLLVTRYFGGLRCAVLVYSLTFHCLKARTRSGIMRLRITWRTVADLPVFDATQPATFLRNGAHPPLYYALIAALIAPIDRSDFPAEYHFNLASPLITRGAIGHFAEFAHSHGA